MVMEEEEEEEKQEANFVNTRHQNAWSGFNQALLWPIPPKVVNFAARIGDPPEHGCWPEQLVVVVAPAATLG